MTSAALFPQTDAVRLVDTVSLMGVVIGTGCVAPVEPLSPTGLPEDGASAPPPVLARCPGPTDAATVWRHPESFEEGASAGRAAVYPAARLSNVGRGFVAWNQSEPDQLVVQERADGVWQDPRTSELGFLAPMLPRFEAEVASNTCGEAIAVWPALDGERLQLRFRRFDGSRWGAVGLLLPELALATRTVSYRVAMAEDGRALVAWTYPRSGFVEPPLEAGRVLAARVDVTGAVRPVQWPRAAGVVASAPVLSARGDGTIFSAWSTAEPDALVTAVIAVEGNFREVADLYAGVVGGSPRLASTLSGETLVAWIANERGVGALLLAERRAGAWGTPRRVAEVPLGADFDVGLSDDGSALLVWRTSDGRARVSVRKRAEDWEHERGASRNLEFGAGDARRPRVAFDGAGNAVLAWLQFVDERCGGGPCARVFVAELREGRLVEPEDASDAISLSGTSANFPRVASNRTGQFIVTWAQRDPTTCPDGCWSVYRSERR